MRSSIYSPSKHPQEYLQFSKEGKTRAEICAEWGISRDTLNRWEKDDLKPEFSDAISIGDAAREAFYIIKLREMAFGRIQGNIRAFVWLTQNTLKWGVQQTIPDHNPYIIAIRNPEVLPQTKK